MAFCIKCGSQLAEGVRFCEKCGNPVAGPAAPIQPPPVQYAPPPAQYAPAPAAGPKKISPIVWILGGVGVLFVLIVVGVMVTGLFVAKKVSDAGFDPDLMAKNPVLAAARMAAAANPDVEVVKMDESAGTLTIRDKKTGKVITMNAEDVKEGKITFTDENTGEKVQVSGGAAAKLPDWVPSYPGSNPEGNFSATGGEGEGGMASFKTSDPASKVLEFYQNEFKSAGYKTSSTSTGTEGGMVIGEDEANKRTIMATVSAADGSTQVMLNYATKN